MSRTEENILIKNALSGPEGLRKLVLRGFENSAGTRQNITVSFQTFGPEIGAAPVVLVNHSLTGNSQVSGENGWWSQLIGPGTTIDTRNYTVLAIDMPGNGFTGDKEDLIHNYKEFKLRDFARMYIRVLDILGVDKLFAAIGGSIGGALAWEIAALDPDLIDHLIPIATDFKTTDWVLAHCKVQEQILLNSVTPVHDARMHAMTLYRTPQSLSSKFGNKSTEGSGEFEVHNWLSHHGKSLENRFRLASYKLMNHLLTTVDISCGTGKHIRAAEGIRAHKHIITIDSDCFFLAKENWDAYVELATPGAAVSIHEISSIHGHDAFLIEYRQLSKFLTPVFKPQNFRNEENQYRALWSR